MTAKIKKAIKSNRPVKIIVHFNKKNSKHNLPWTVHIRGVCIPASVVIWDGVIPKTVWKPLKDTNPRGWIECTGYVVMKDNNTVKVIG